MLCASRRSAFTLLEVLLASAIGILLMAALYVAVEVQLRHAQVGRDVVERSTLARALLNRIAQDIAPSLAPPLPIPSTSSGGATAGTQQPQQPSTDPNNPMGQATQGAGTTGTGSTPAQQQPPATTAAVQSNVMVQGDATQLMLTITRVPRELAWVVDNTSNESQPVASDIRRINIWMAGGDVPLGLARSEVKIVTSEDAALTPADISDPSPFIIAPEVQSLSFSYWDGSQWQESWDGTQPGEDGSTAKGPPLGIAITLGIWTASQGYSSDGAPNLKYYRHFVAIPTANGLPMQNAATTTGQ